MESVSEYVIYIHSHMFGKPLVFYTQLRLTNNSEEVYFKAERTSCKMRSLLMTIALACIGHVTAFPESVPGVDYSVFKEEDIITRDVCVLGGGSGGTYAATRLHQLGQSVIIVEKESVMGGNTNTYTVPSSGLTIDYGVVVFHNISIVRDYFSYYKVALGPAGFASANHSYNVDFRTGNIVEGYVSPDPTAALQIWLDQLNKHPYLAAGINLPDPVPEELVIPFKDFVEEFDLADMVNAISEVGQGFADLLDQPTLYAMKLLGVDLVRTLETGYIATAAHDNHAIYDAATVEYVLSLKHFLCRLYR